MSDEKQTRKKLLDAAKKEFMKKGYYKASLRCICKEAGVTTGALYFFFEDKKDLFSTLVQKPIRELVEIINAHYKEELADGTVYLNDDDDDIATAKRLIDYMYANEEILMLLLTKADGSGYETFTDEIIRFSDEHYRRLADNMTDLTGGPGISDYTVHWLSHMQTEMFIDFLVHGLTKEEALDQVEILIRYMKRGWESFFQ